MEFAFGFLGLSRDEFWDMTRREFINACRGFGERIKIEDRKADERARAIAYTVYCGVPKAKGRPNMSIDAFWPLDEKPKLTKEERQQRYKQLESVKS